MEWIEKNGPPVRQPRRTGFGTRLIDLVIQRQLNGEVTRTYSLKGMAVKMLLPLTRERWPTAFVAERPQPSENDSVRRL
jgi:two-component sensor histidine kinase